MTVEELLRIVHEEGLDAPALDGVRPARADAVVLETHENTWRVFLVDERSNIHDSMLSEFDHESEALEHVLLKLRQVQRARRAMAAVRSAQNSNP